MLWRCWLGGRKGIRSVKNWVVACWRGYLSGTRCRLAYRPADATATHVSWFSEIQIGFTFLVPAHPGSPRQRAVKRMWVCGSGKTAYAYDHWRLTFESVPGRFRIAALHRCCMLYNAVCAIVGNSCPRSGWWDCRRRSWDATGADSDCWRHGRVIRHCDSSCWQPLQGHRTRNYRFDVKYCACVCKLLYYWHCPHSVSNVYQGLCNGQVSSPSLSHLSTTAAACSGFAAVGPAAGDIDGFMHGASIQYNTIQNLSSDETACSWLTVPIVSLSLHIHSSLAVSSKCEQCRVYSNVGNFNSDLFLMMSITWPVLMLIVVLNTFQYW